MTLHDRALRGCLWHWLFGWRCTDLLRGNKQARILYGYYPDMSLVEARLVHAEFVAARKNHRLVKDYKLVRDVINDPVVDARLSLSLFQEQYQAFQTMAKEEPDLIRFYHFCFLEMIDCIQKPALIEFITYK